MILVIGAILETGVLDCPRISALHRLMMAALLLALAQPGLPEVVRLRPPKAAEAEKSEVSSQDPSPTDSAPTDAPPQSTQAPEPMLPPRASLVGEWALGIAGRSTLCRITLSNHAANQASSPASSSGVYIASLGDNCPQILFAVSRWRLSESALILSNRSGRALARLYPKERGWRGPTLDNAGREGPDAMMEKAPTR
jgi:hypothetical protein